MEPWVGPGTPFETLFHVERSGTLALDEGATAVYGQWDVPIFDKRPYVYVNFVTSRDGRVSFNIPEAMGGNAVSQNNLHDQWLMGLLRARADAIMVGDNTLKLEPDHLWTADFIFPRDARGFAALRETEGRARWPLQVFVSARGIIPEEAAVLRESGLRIVVATTIEGARNARARVGIHSNVEILACGEAQVDFHALYGLLWSNYRVRTLLCEGGPRLYGSIVRAGAIDDEFLTLSPVVVGNVSGSQQRPGLVEGVAFQPDDAPVTRLLSVRKAGDYLFLQSRYA